MTHFPKDKHPAQKRDSVSKSIKTLESDKEGISNFKDRNQNKDRNADDSYETPKQPNRAGRQADASPLSRAQFHGVSAKNKGRSPSAASASTSIPNPASKKASQSNQRAPDDVSKIGLLSLSKPPTEHDDKLKTSAQKLPWAEIDEVGRSPGQQGVPPTSQNQHAPKGATFIHGVATPPASPPASGNATFPKSTPNPQNSALPSQSISTIKTQRHKTKQIRGVLTHNTQPTSLADLVRWSPENLRNHSSRHSAEFAAEMAGGKTYEQISLEFFRAPLDPTKGRVGIKEKTDGLEQILRFDYGTGIFGILSRKNRDETRLIKSVFKPRYGERNCLARAATYYENKK